jgi:hypothetical protein
MEAITYDSPDWEDFDEAESGPRRRRPRVRKETALLVVVLLAGAGFLGGVEVEKHHLSSSTSGAASTLARAFSRTGATGGARTGAAGAGFGGFGGAGFSGGAGAGGGSTTTGTVSAVNGSTLYVSETSGNTVAVHVPSSAAVTKSQTVSLKSIKPGDSVIVTGLTSGSTVVATAVRDSGPSASSSSGSAPTVSSLFGGGGSSSSGSSGSSPSSSGGSSSSSSSSSEVNSLFG